MVIREAIYKNITGLLRNLSVESDNIGIYSNDLGTLDKQNLLIELAERIESQLTHNINVATEEDRVMTFDSSAFNLILEYKDNFPEYPGARYDEILLIMTLLNLLNSILQEDEELDHNRDVDDSMYSLIDFGNDRFGTDVFHFVDLNHWENSFIFFNFKEITAVLEYFKDPDITLPSDFLVIFIANIGSETLQILPRCYALLFHETAANKPKSKAYLAINFLINGKIFHKPYEYTKDISLKSLRSLSVTNNYHQFRDILIILSEYTAQDDILDKFLRLYHVVENFMFKSPLVYLEREQLGKPFSFRDFQRIQSNINRSEIESLKKLLKKVFPLTHRNGVSFAAYIYDEIDRVLNREFLISEPNFDTLLSLLKLEKKKNGNDPKFSDISLENIEKYYAEILYAIRCSIVHNKESEFHLTHDVLFNHALIGESTKILLEEFLMPTMEEIIIFLLTENNNDIVWFSNNTLVLWETA